MFDIFDVLPLHVQRLRANMAHIGQSRPADGLGFQVKVLKIFPAVRSSLESGPAALTGGRLFSFRFLLETDYTIASY